MNHVVEVVKEFLRNALLGGISYLLVEGVLNTLVLGVVGERLDLQYVAILVALLGYILRGIEKQLHKAEKLSLPF